MASESSGFHTDQSSHFSGRPAPPYHLVDVTRDYLTGAVAVARHPPRIEVIEEAARRVTDETASFPGRWSEDDDSVVSRHGVVNQERSNLRPHSAHGDNMLSPATEAGRMRQAAHTARQNTISTELSISEDGGCLVPPSSASSQLQILKLDQLSVGPYSNDTWKMKTGSWQNLPSPSQAIGAVRNDPNSSETPGQVISPSIAQPSPDSGKSQLIRTKGLIIATTPPPIQRLERRFTAHINYEEYASTLRQRERRRNLIRDSQEIIVERYFKTWRLPFISLQRKALLHKPSGME